ncbi:transcriptional regulator, LysR family [Cognatiyoonia koreensis]|uniref:Transcriptional regulator, LysR family n=1 Tax=Cognatiyoonia koreensis TaxID=364200 RepID=A0A1I0RFW8_9RHOB|nr:transcriptional regulator GcvA [Cognatiyoonia koreensis]SEW39803.1 transcriptional regulator, LysR family [Cognatiyoonia koreensis]
MPDRLPSLTSLRAFEAAARHMSFAKAADELFVTPAALSYQIKSLESELGHPLFRRLNRAVELTEAGRMLAPATRDAFGKLMSAWRDVRRLQDTGILTVTAGPAFTAKWLAPRMYDFAQAHPEIELRFVAGLRLADFDRDEVDVAIRFGLEADDSLHAEPLIEEWVTPMMTPQMAEHIKEPADLKDAILVHDESMSSVSDEGSWANWTKVQGIDIDTSHGPRFSQADHALDAAMSGAGVVLGRVSLAARAMEAGRLVAPFELGIIVSPKFRFVCPKGNETLPKIAAFHDWVLQEISQSGKFRAERKMVHAADIV